MFKEDDINRYNTKSLKYDFKKDKNKPDDVLPMWVADMDFKCPDVVIDDMKKRLDHGVLGYTKNDLEYFNVVSGWFKENFKIDLEPEWLVITPGVVFALATAVKVLTNVDDYVLINNPVYYPFTEVIKDNKRKVISSDLVLVDDHYEIDFKDLEKRIVDNNVKLYLLCSPHNPVGRVWTNSELDKVVEICKRHNVYIVSDEIHSDFVWEGKHTNILSYKEYSDHLILCTAPTKTFNLAGLQISNIFIPNKELRENFQNEVWNTGYSLVNVMGLVACMSAYEKGKPWLDEAKRYLKENIDYVDNYLKSNLKKIKLIKPEGTYLLWLDFKDLSLTSEEVENILLNDAKIWLDNGNMFGDLGEGYQRINIALSREKLEYAMSMLKEAFKDY